jgi:hypothetical protein
MTNDELKMAFEAFLRKQTEQSDEENLRQMLSTPYGESNGKLAAAFHLFKTGYELGVAQNG